MVRRSSSTSRGTTYWFQYFSLFPMSGVSFAHAQVIRTEMDRNVTTKGKGKARSHGPRNLEHGGGSKSGAYARTTSTATRKHKFAH